MSDRQTILRNARNINKDSKISIRTDLPIHLKVKRGKLAKIAYNMRRPGGVKTFIKETKSDVTLFFKRESEDKWQKFEYSSDSTEMLTEDDKNEQDGEEENGQQNSNYY